MECSLGFIEVQEIYFEGDDSTKVLVLAGRITLLRELKGIGGAKAEIQIEGFGGINVRESVEEVVEKMTEKVEG